MQQTMRNCLKETLASSVLFHERLGNSFFKYLLCKSQKFQAALLLFAIKTDGKLECTAAIAASTR